MPKQRSDKKGVPLSFRPSSVTEVQLDNLMEAWGESRADVIARCIERCWTQECFTTAKEE